MKIKIVLLALAAVLLVPGLNVFAESSPEPYSYENGLLDDPYIIKNTLLSVDTYDNDLSTQVGPIDNLVYFIEFTEPVDVKQMYFKADRIVDFEFVFIGGSSKTMSFQSSSNNFHDINMDDVIRIEFSESTYSYNGIYEFDFFGSYGTIIDTTPPGEVSGLVSETTVNSTAFNYNLPTEEDFSHIKILKDGVLLADNVTTTNYTAAGLNSDTSYSFTLKTVDLLGNESKGVTQIIKTEPLPLGEVENLKIKADYDQVDLSWTLPGSDRLKHVNIYRDEITKVSFFDKVTGTMTAYAAATKIFETNGTYFNDFTVEPEKEYEYTVTTTDTAGVESDGVTVKTGTPKAPIIDTSKIDLPFSPLDLLKSGNSLMMAIGGFLLLALSFLLVPRLIRMIKRALGKESKKEEAARIERARQRIERQERNRQNKENNRQPKEAKAPKAERMAAADKTAATERQRKQTLAYATGPAVKEAKTGRTPRAGRERQPKPQKAPRIPRERNRRERTPRKERG